MKNKQTIKLKYFVDTEIENYEIRSKVLDRHLNDVYPTARTAMRYDMDLQKYSTTTIINTFVSSATEEIIQTLAAIMNGILQLSAVTYQIGTNTPVVITKRLKETRDTWYTDAGKDDDEEQTA